MKKQRISAGISKSICFLLALLMLAALASCGGYAPQSEGAASMPAATPAEDAWPDEEGYYDGWGWPDEPTDPQPAYPGEEYDQSPESPFKEVLSHPLSTFSSDVDTASYSNLCRQITGGQQPSGVRIEELVNYFDYDYPRPRWDGEHPFTVTTEVADCPWNEGHRLAMIGVQGAEVSADKRPASNIVFLLDVSGSMDAPNKLPLLQHAFKLLIDQLDENDTISIVTYAGSQRVLADSVPGSEHRRLKNLIDDLYAGGGTAGAQGLRTAYDLARENYREGGNNRIILATDGDFNVGESSDDAMIDLIEAERDKGVFISVLGFGMGNLKDSKMEKIADHGNGNYAYIDTQAEAEKVLVHEFSSTMFTIAKDLKIQVAFNPAVVGQYRLIGYSNRLLQDEEFEDDTKDAGDIGAGHSVTAFYELIPASGAEAPAADNPYMTATATGSTDYMTVRLRYKAPHGDESKLAEYIIDASAYSRDYSASFGFASAVAEFGLIVTDSQYRADSSLSSVLERAQNCTGKDPYGLRAEFCQLVKTYRDAVN